MISLGLRGTQGLALCDKTCMIRQVFVASLVVKDGVHMDQKRGVHAMGMGARAQVSSCCRVLAWNSEQFKNPRSKRGCSYGYECSDNVGS